MTSDNAALIAEAKEVVTTARRAGFPLDLANIIERLASALEAAERRNVVLETERDRARLERDAAATMMEVEITARDAAEDRADASAAEAAALREALPKLVTEWSIARRERLAEHALSLTPSAAAQRVRAVIDAARSVYRARETFPMREPGSVQLKLERSKAAHNQLGEALAALDHPEAGKDAT